MWTVPGFLVSCALLALGCGAEVPQDDAAAGWAGAGEAPVPVVGNGPGEPPPGATPPGQSDPDPSPPDSDPPVTQPGDPGEPPPVEDPGPPGGPLDACYTTALGALGEDSDPIQYGGQPVQVTAQHGDGCLTGLALKFTKGGQCPLQVTFGVEGGLWTLQGATLRSDPECGNGWGSGKTYATGPGADGTLLGVPSAIPKGDQACTILDAPIDLAGTIQMTAGGNTIEVGLAGLSIEGLLLSAQGTGGVCGQSPQACTNLECGIDPLFGTSCGTCGPGMFCMAGMCQEGTPAQEACARFNADRAVMKEYAWNGSIAACNAGEMSLDWQEAALLNVNLYRWFAGVEPLALNPAYFAGEQKCALMLHANKSLSHNPPAWWACYDQSGADSAGNSNIATMPAVVAGDLYMIDPGNATTMGHRRWIIGNWLKDTAFGSTSDYSCMATKWSNSGVSNAAWTAWPPAGFYPLDWHDMGWTNTDDTGYTLQSDTINLKNAQVTITESGQNRPVTKSNLNGGYGSKHAIKFIPQGWKMKPNSTYTVNVTGTSQPIQYEIHTLDCSAM